MKITKSDGTVEDVSTGVARRLIQSGEAQDGVQLPKSKSDDKHKSKSTGAKADSIADVSGG